MLHIISNSPFENAALKHCLNTAAPGDVLLLISDGVYTSALDKNAFANVSVFAIQEHAEARGIHLAEWIQGIDYNQMVALTEQHHPIQSWY